MSYAHVVSRRPRWMFRAIAVGIAIGCLLSSAATARADLLAYEGFNYSTGTDALTGSGSASDPGWASAWNGVTGHSNVAVGSLGYPYLEASGNHATFDDNLSRANRYVDVSSGGTFDLAGLVDAGKVGADGTTLYLSFMQQISVVPGSAPDDLRYYAFEVSKGNGNADRLLLIGHDDYTPSPYYVARTHSNESGPIISAPLGTENADVNLFVVKFTFDANDDRVDIYRNPSLGLEPATPTVTFGGPGLGYDFAFDRIAAARFIGNNPVLGIDEIRFGTTYADVTPIPEPVSVVLLIGGGLGLLLMRGSRGRRRG